MCSTFRSWSAWSTSGFFDFPVAPEGHYDYWFPPCPHTEMATHPVSTLVNNPKSDDPRWSVPVK
jgi:hypothetical protein